MMKNLFFCIVFASLSLFAFAAGQTASASGQGSGHESLPMGYGNIKPEEMKDILEALDRSKAGPMARPEGLCMVKVDY